MKKHIDSEPPQVQGDNTNSLYSADTLADHNIALFREGEFDTLLARQEADELTVVTLSSATATLSSRLYADLTHCHMSLVAYDRDAAGEKGAKRLLYLSPRFCTIQVLYGKDIDEFHLQSEDIYAWTGDALKDHQSVLEEIAHAL